MGKFNKEVLDLLNEDMKVLAMHLYNHKDKLYLWDPFDYECCEYQDDMEQHGTPFLDATQAYLHYVVKLPLQDALRWNQDTMHLSNGATKLCFKDDNCDYVIKVPMWYINGEYSDCLQSENYYVAAEALIYEDIKTFYPYLKDYFAATYLLTDDCMITIQEKIKSNEYKTWDRDDYDIDADGLTEKEKEKIYNIIDEETRERNDEFFKAIFNSNREKKTIDVLEKLSKILKHYQVNDLEPYNFRINNKTGKPKAYDYCGFIDDESGDNIYKAKGVMV